MSAKKAGRTSESEFAVVALRIAADSPHGEVTTTQMKKKIPNYVELTPGDLKQSETRTNEKMHQQIIGNIVSHWESGGNIIGKGYAEYTGSGIRITDAGRAFLRSLGY